MPHALYVCLQDEDKIASFAMDADTGQLTHRTEMPVAGGPSVMAISPDRQASRFDPTMLAVAVLPSNLSMTLL